MSVADFPDWQEPQAHASAIAATGVPLLTAKNLLELVNSASVNAGGTRNGNVAPVTQTSYEITVQLTIGPAATVPFAQVALAWIDSGTHQQVARDTFVIPCASTGGLFWAYGKGPIKADQVQVQVSNLDPSVSLNVTYTIWQHSRVVTADIWQWRNLADTGMTVPGWTLPTLPDDESVLGMLGGVSVPASGSLTYLFGMHAGLIAVALDQGGGPWTNISLKIAAQPNSNYTINNQVYAAVSPPPAFTIAGPRAPLRVILSNSATTAFTATMSLIRAD